MKNIILGLCLSVTGISALMAQTSYHLPDGFHITDSQSFSGSTLYGHINGGAELFLEYGFEKLDYLQLKKDGVEYSVDIYKMSDPFAAYGIFSIKRFRCTESKLPVRFYCQTPYQLSVQRAEYFITLANDKGTPAAQNESEVLIEKILETIENNCINIPVFADFFLFENPSFPILVKGTLGFQNALPSWESFFSGFGGYECFYQEGVNEKSKVEFFQVFFYKEEDARKFMSSKNWSARAGFQDSNNNWYASQEGALVNFAKGKIKPVPVQ